MSARTDTHKLAVLPGYRARHHQRPRYAPAVHVGDCVRMDGNDTVFEVFEYGRPGYVAETSISTPKRIDNNEY